MSSHVPKLPASTTVNEINAALDEHGVLIIDQLFSPDLIERLNAELQPYVDAYRQPPVNSMYDDFLGHSTVRLHAICAKSDSFPEVLTDPRLMGVMNHVLGPNCVDFRLSAAELIEIGDGESAQPLHRDDDSWPPVARAASPLVANVMIALTEYRDDNGATVVVPGSHNWPLEREPTDDECVSAVMAPGSAAIFRGDVLHGGGTNRGGPRRRGLSVAYCHGWLVPVENSWLGVPPEQAKHLPERAQELLGYDLYDGTSVGCGVINMYEVGNPKAILVDA